MIAIVQPLNLNISPPYQLLDLIRQIHNIINNKGEFVIKNKRKYKLIIIILDQMVELGCFNKSVIKHTIKSYEYKYSKIIE